MLVDVRSSLCRSTSTWKINTSPKTSSGTPKTSPISELRVSLTISSETYWPITTSNYRRSPYRVPDILPRTIEINKNTNSYPNPLQNPSAKIRLHPTQLHSSGHPHWSQRIHDTYRNQTTRRQRKHPLRRQLRMGYPQLNQQVHEHLFSVEEFVDQLLKDYELDRKYFAEICYKIRTQINSELEWKFDLLVKTFKSIHKDRESPKLNSTQTLIQRRPSQCYDATSPTRWTWICPTLIRNTLPTQTCTSTTQISSVYSLAIWTSYLSSSNKSSCARTPKTKIRTIPN